MDSAKNEAARQVATTHGPARGDGLVGVVRTLGTAMVRLPRLAGVVLAAAWMCFSWWLSSGTRGPEGSSPVFGFVANLAHAPLFGLLALWWIVALPRRREPFDWAAMSRTGEIAVFGAVVAWGFVDEWHQSFVAGRDSSLADIATDSVGAMAVLVTAAYVGRPDASARGLVRLLAAGIAACAAAAFVATVV